jgi:hypothetical protein
LKQIFIFKAPRNTGLLHRRVPLNNLPDYLMTGASRQLIVHRAQSSSASSVSHYDDNSGFFNIEQNGSPRSYSGASHKRHYDDELTYSNKRHLLTKRTIPVNHQRPILVRDEKAPVGKKKNSL